MAEYVQVMKRALQQLGGHGGVRGLMWQLLSFIYLEQQLRNNSYPFDCPNKIFERVNDLKIGTLVGTDKYGNKYYEDKRYFFGRHRWVIYTAEMDGKNTYWDLDGSMIPPEWHRWIHCMTEEPPTTHPPVSRKFIFQNHKMNESGTSKQYVPYSTTRKKIQEWVPPSTPSK